MDEFINWVIGFSDEWSIPAMFWSFPIYLVMQVIALKKTGGLWWFAAFFPLIPMLAVLVITIIGFSERSNLWPIMLLFTSPAAFIYMCAFFILWGGWKKFGERRSNQSLKSGTPQSGAP